MRLAAVAAALLTVRIGCSHFGASHAALPGPAEVPGARVAIATCREDELLLLPGVGPARAKAIYAFVREHGPPRTPLDLEAIDGIGPVTAARMAPYIDFSQPSDFAK